MKVYLLKSIERVGISGEILNVTRGYFLNYLFPNKLAIEINEKSEKFFENIEKKIQNRKEVISSEKSILSEKLSNLKFVIKKKFDETGKMYGSVGAAEIVEFLDTKGIKISKSQVVINKNIKTEGEFKVIIKLSSKLMPELLIKVIK